MRSLTYPWTHHSLRRVSISMLERRPEAKIPDVDSKTRHQEMALQ